MTRASVALSWCNTHYISNLNTQGPNFLSMLFNMGVTTRSFTISIDQHQHQTGVQGSVGMFSPCSVAVPVGPCRIRILPPGWVRCWVRGH
jgi:hypothetical protein